jgi:hypothetical protein
MCTGPLICQACFQERKIQKITAPSLKELRAHWRKTIQISRSIMQREGAKQSICKKPPKELIKSSRKWWEPEGPRCVIVVIREAQRHAE